MAQTYELLQSGVTTFGELYGKINNLVEALRSSFSGESFPNNPVAGQLCWRTDRKKWYIYVNDTSVGENGWVEIAIASAGLGAEIINARGSKSSLDERLDVSLNEDGTLKANVAAYQSEWIKPSLTFTYVDSTIFTVEGDQTDIYVPTRRLKINLEASVAYSEVASASYDDINNITTVTIADAVLDSTLVDIEHSIISPIDANGAVSLPMLGLQKVKKINNADGSIGQEIILQIPNNVFWVRFKGSHTSSVTFTISYSSDGVTYTSYKTIDGTSIAESMIADNEDGSCNYLKLSTTAGVAGDTVSLAISAMLLFEKPF